MRNWSQFHDPKNLIQAISIEAGELQEIFLWKTTEESKKITTDETQKVKNELADIFIFMTYLCNHFGIDLLDAVECKLQLNAEKYPVSKSKGNRQKYTELK
jgi:NTP pyrophosphatase (non-canonical NTP hydrolase)